VYGFVGRERANHHVTTMCRLFGVSPSGFFAWVKRPPSARALSDATLLVRIRAIHEHSRATYGVPRVHAALRAEGIGVGRKRVARLMTGAGLRGVHRRRFVVTTRRDEAATPAPDLVGRSFTAQAPDRLYVADITYLPTWQGFLYLAAIVDVFSRRVVGWAMAATMQAELVLAALDMAIERRRPAPGLVHHSDHGSQYTSLAFGRRLREAKVLPSMGSVGDAYDNALAESFFASLETELIHRSVWRTHDEARLAVFDYIEVFYNRARLHSGLGYLSPDEYERRYLLTKTTAA
jgi:putative transposase